MVMAIVAGGILAALECLVDFQVLLNILGSSLRSTQLWKLSVTRLVDKLCQLV